MVRVLIVEDDTSFVQAWTELFQNQNFEVDVAAEGRKAREKLRLNFYDMIMVPGIMRGGESGIELCRDYRKSHGLSAVLLTSNKHSSEEMEAAIDAGADDYMAKPIKLRELAARTRSLLRRQLLMPNSILQANDVVLDLCKAAVYVRGREVHLHPMELNLLEFLMTHPNQVFTAEVLLDRVWQDRERASLASVRTHIKTLRHKLELPGLQRLIRTVRGRGYKVVT